MNQAQRRILSTALLLVGVLALATLLLNLFVASFPAMEDATAVKFLLSAIAAITAGLYVRAGGPPSN